MKTVKKFSALLLCLVLLTIVPMNVAASESGSAVLKSANVLNTATTFTISSGTAHVRNSYVGRSSTFKSASISTKIQKKVGVVWITVSGGSWTDTSSSTNYAKSHSVSLSSKGTYRAHVVFTIYGSGDTDKITKNVERDYQ